MTCSSYPSRAQIETDQLAKLRPLIAALLKSNNFYSPRLADAGITPDIESISDFVHRMPLTTKQDLVDDQQSHPPYGTNLTYDLSQYTRFHQTSGTTRTPIRWLDTNESWSWMLDNWARVFEAAGVTESDHIYFAFSFGPFLGFWTAFESALRIGCMAIPGGGMTSALRLRAMIDNGATVLCCTPTYSLRLAEVAARENIDLSQSKVRAIIAAGEPGASIPATRKLMEDAWNGAKVVDHHGMTEIGPVSYENPNHTGMLHIIESAFIAEVIDTQSLQPVEPGQTGELILTNLGRTGSPLLRYRTGDIVRPATATPEQLQCSDLALGNGILGRCDDMVVIRSVNIFPSAIEEVIRSQRDIAEFQVEVSTQRQMAELSVTIEAAPDCPDPKALLESITQALQNATSIRVPVDLVEPGTLPRYEMKAKRWIMK